MTLLRTTLFRCEGLLRRTLTLVSKESSLTRVPRVCAGNVRHLSTLTKKSGINSVSATYSSMISRLFSKTQTKLCAPSATKTAVVDDASVLWENLLRFDYIPVVVFLNRLKIAQTVLTFMLLPTVAHMCFIAQTEPVETFYLVTAMTALAAVMLLVITRISQRIVMLLYVNPERTRLRVSHLSFWGFRRETYYDLSEFQPVSLTKDDWNEMYVRLRLPERGYHLYIAPRYATVPDQRTFMELLD